jgi:hypothetical protein
MRVEDSFRIKGVPCVCFFREKCEVGDKLMDSKTGEVFTVIRTEQMMKGMGQTGDNFIAYFSGDKVPEQNANLYLVGKENE